MNENDEMNELIMEMMRKDNTISVLNEKVFELMQENESLKQTLKVIMNRNKKRGDDSRMININIQDAIKESFDYLKEEMFKTLNGKTVNENIVTICKQLLVGPDECFVPFAHMDANTISYKENGDIQVVSMDEFTNKLHEMIAIDLINVCRMCVNDEQENEQMIEMIMLINNKEKFKNCLKKAIKLYRTII
jgi:hypothetical protein